MTGSVTEGSVFGKGLYWRPRFLLAALAITVFLHEPQREREQTSKGSGLCILRETSLSTIHLRQLGKWKGHEGLLSCSHKSEIIKQDIKEFKVDGCYVDYV